MLKKLIAKAVVKKGSKILVKKEAKILVGALLTIGTHKAIQKAARKFPALRFLKTAI